MAPYSFTDKDRALAADSRKRERIETALICNNCYAMGCCKHFRLNRVCALRKELKPFSSSPDDCLKKINELISNLEERAWQNRYFEKLDGGVADENVSGLMNSLIQYHLLLARLYEEMQPSKDRATVKSNDLLEPIFADNLHNITMKSS